MPNNSLERTGDAAAKAKVGFGIGHLKGYEMTVPGRSARSRYPTAQLPDMVIVISAFGTTTVEVYADIATAISPLLLLVAVEKGASINRVGQ